MSVSEREMSTNHGLYEPPVMFFGLTNSPRHVPNDEWLFPPDIRRGGNFLHGWYSHLISRSIEKLPKKFSESLPITTFSKMRMEDDEDRVAWAIDGIKMDSKVATIRDWPTPRNSNDSLASRTFIDTLSQISRPSCTQLTGNIEWKWGGGMNELNYICASTRIYRLPI